MSKKNKYQIWQGKRKRIKYHIVQKNISNLPRLVVFRSNSNIYAQLIDDEKQTTLLSSSSIDINLKKSVENFNLYMSKVPNLTNEINGISSSIKKIVDNLYNGDGTISKLINQDEIYNNVNGLITDARELLDDVKNNPTKYLKAYFQAKKK